MFTDRGILLGDVKKNVQKSVLYVQTSCFAQKQYKCINAFLIVFIAVVVVVATALYFDLKGHSVVTYGSKNPKMYKFVYSETIGYYENVPLLLRGTFNTYSVSANENETFIIK